ncbi:hypothetical protein XA68_13531 [Ophiocordyceps unilateralis]|uniref:Uncharacterized protein n=1 Tax=Ophiocordyceps unilateralis TaxID=268505 RepID=A0A2A9PCE7_OPHUN|nr:hypothetical protein XA68_13531 [Ophiocordyceps unilateralis]
MQTTQFRQLRLLLLLQLLVFTLSVSAIQTRAHPPPLVYILASTEQTSTTAVSEALQTLGFTYLDTSGNSSGSVRDSGDSVYTFISHADDDTSYKRLAASRPQARFILPTDSSSVVVEGAARPTHTHHLVRHFFARGRQAQLLELDVGRRLSVEQAENWVMLCRFLGLGYSMVERMKLWYFPR